MTHIMNNIEMLRERLNNMIESKTDTMKLYEISIELDTWITQYYKEQ